MAKANEEHPILDDSKKNAVAEAYIGTQERTFQESALVFDSYLKPYNPDDLVRKWGDYRIYEQMRNDDQISVALQLKKDLVVGSGWTINTEKEENEDIATDIYQRLEEDPEVAFDEQLEELIDSAYVYGLALSEKIFQFRDDNSLTFKELKTRHPGSFILHTDERGNMIRYEQQGPKASIDVNPKSLIHYINNRQFQNPYGRSDLRPAHSAWIAKNQFVAYYATFGEKFASPIPVARYDRKVPRDKVLEVFNVIKSFMQKTAMAVPKDFEIEFLQSKSTGEVYTKGIDMFNMFMGRALVIPDLLGFSGGNTNTGGAFSLGKAQMNVFFKHIAKRRRLIERIVNRHIIEPLVIWNYGFLDGYPKFSFLPISDDDATEFAKSFLEAVKGKVYKPSDDEINHFRSLIKFPEGEVDRYEEVSKTQGQGFDSEEEEEGEQEASGSGEAGGSKDAKDKEGGAADKEKKEFAVFKQVDGDFHKKVNFKVIKSQLESTEARIIAEATPIIDSIFQDIYAQIEKKKILEGSGGHPDRIDSIKIKNLKALKKIISTNLLSHYRASKSIAKAELFKNKFSQPTTAQEFLDLLEQENFNFIGDWEYNISKSLRQQLINAIKEGRPVSEVIDMLDSETKKASAVSLERYSRTKTTEVMNRARLEQFEESGVVNGFQYSAILDGRTSEICAGLHGKKFKAGTEPVPPLHFNCRSLLIPITIFEEFSPDKSVGKKSIDRFIEDNKGSGFSTK